MLPIAISAFSDNYIWAMVQQESGTFICVDPGDASPVLQFAKAQQLSLQAILLTHHHFDHIDGVADLLNQFPDCEVYGPKDVRIATLTKPVEKQDLISLSPYKFEVLANPGHTSTHISYYELHRGWLFCGDTLFSAGCGRVFDGTMQELHQSLQMFKQLPPSTLIFCAHEYTLNNLRFAQSVEPNNKEIEQYLHKLKAQALSCSLPSTLVIECAVNPFLRTDVPAVQEYALRHGAGSTDSLAVFSVLREQKNLFR